MRILAKRHPDDSASLPFAQVYPYNDVSLFTTQFRSRCFLHEGIDLSSLTLIFTPTTSYTQTLLRTVDTEHTISIGLSQCNWTRAFQEDRRTLVALIIRALSDLLHLTLPRVASVYQTEHECMSWDPGACDVPLSPRTYEDVRQLGLGNLDSSQVQQLSSALHVSLKSTGKSMSPPMGKYFGRNHDRLVLTTTEEESGLQFALVPGGTYTPGYREEQLVELGTIAERLSVGEGEECELPYMGRRDPVSIAPMLVARCPVVCMTDRSQVMSDREYALIHQTTEPIPLQCEWYQGVSVCKCGSWSLTNSEEAEYAARGGEDGLFYWGNEPNQVMACSHSGSHIVTVPQSDVSWKLIESAVVPGECEEWPISNGFGLCKILSFRMWCNATSLGNGTLCTLGGAANTWPWQGCNEWLYFCACYQESISMDASRRACVRPIIRFRKE